jgi:uncharacterized protein YndB with AHSA1/START domain
MWKWIAGGALLLIVLLAGTCYYGLRKFTEGGGSAVVMIDASPDRVFASLADPDSLSTWVDVGSTVTSSRHGLLEAGDSFTIVRPPIKAGRAGERASYLVLTVDPGHTMALELVNDSLLKVARITRYDSLSASNDSTRLSVTYAAEILDSARISVRDSGKGSSAMLGFAEKMIVAAMRLATEQDLQRLKARIERH